MNQQWWVYALIAFGCLVMYLVSKVVENKVLKDAEIDLDFMYFMLGLLGFLATLKAANVLNLI